MPPTQTRTQRARARRRRRASGPAASPESSAPPEATPSAGSARTRPLLIGGVLAAVAVLVIGAWVMIGGTGRGATAPSADPAAVAAARQQALSSLKAQVDAKNHSCDALAGATYTMCISQFAEIAKQYNDLLICLGGATTMDAVTSCERQVGLSP